VFGGDGSVPAALREATPSVGTGAVHAPMKPESNRPITIEDILRLKRAETPAPEFWATFDRELRAKQLSALVGKRPWWRTLPALFGKVSRYRIPLGAGAAVAVAFFSLHNFNSPPASTQAPANSSPVVAMETRTPTDLAIVVDSIPTVHETIAAAAVGTTPEPHDLPVPAVMVAAVSVDEPKPVVAAPAALPGVQIQGSITAAPAAQRVAANLSVVQTKDVVSARRLLDVASGFEERVMPTRAAVEPLQQMVPPGDSRRSRLLTAMVSTASLEASMRTTERAASRLDEEKLYDQIHRFGARGDRVQVKF